MAESPKDFAGNAAQPLHEKAAGDSSNSVDETAETKGSSSESLPYSKDPELIFGLVGSIGVDLDLVVNALCDALGSAGYESHTFRITSLMREVATGLPLDAPHYIESFKQRIEYANKVRELAGRNDALAILAISAIREFRVERNGSAEEPLPKQAYIIRQFKRPEEVKLLRSVYGKQFVQISVHAPEGYRVKAIASKELRSSCGLASDVDARNGAYSLVKQDEIESTEGFGQNVRDAFPLADVVVDASDKDSCKENLERFVRALFGDNKASPTHDEYGMYMAKSASLRSSAPGRQVGAAIFRPTGDVVSLGCNEVPKSGGGTYWTGDKGDARDFVDGSDANDLKKRELLVDLMDRLERAQCLSQELSDIKDATRITDKVLQTKGPNSVKESKIMDIIEFNRDIHAEMSAIGDAARTGVAIKGSTLYCTVFPCHICAKHIVGAGIIRVVYLEPYSKSYAEALHSDSIEIDGDGSSGKVGFQRFIGISPYRYRDLFEKGKRKYSTGQIQDWNRGEMRPMIEVLYPSYFKAETFVVELLKDRLLKLAVNPSASESIPANAAS